MASSSQEEIKQIKQKLKNKFEMTEVNEVSSFLGIKVEYNRQEGGMMLSQPKLIETAVRRFGVADCKNVKTPFKVGLHLQKPTDKNKNLKLPYRELIGSLMYILCAS